MTKTGRSLFLILFSFFALVCTSNVAHAKIVVSAIVDSDEVSVGDVFPVTVTVTSDDSIEMQNPRPPDLEGFELLSQNKSQAVRQQLMQTEKGMEFQTQRNISYRYDLRTLRQGRYSIGAFEMEINGKTYRTQPIVITVEPPSVGRHQQQPQQQQPRGPNRPRGGGNPFEDMMDEADAFDEEIFNQLLQRRQQMTQEPQMRTMPTNPDEAFFIQVEADKTDVYENEQITASWYIYTRGQVESLDRVKFPDLKGFWKEIIEENPTIRFSEEIINGIPYRKALLASHALFPIKAGSTMIDEFRLKAKVRLMGQGGFGWGPPYEFTKASKKVLINVKPLPTEGRPRSFTGAVGNFQVNTAVEKEQVPVNQPFSLRIRFEGMGNAKLIELPAIDWPSTVEVYDTKSDSKFFKNGTSFKEYEVLLIPRQQGELIIPSFEFSFFDPHTKKYTIQKTTPIQVKVVENPNGNAGDAGAQRIGPGAKSSSIETQAMMPQPVTEWSSNTSTNTLQRMDVMIGLYLLGFLALGFRAINVFGLFKRAPKLKARVEKRRQNVLNLFKNKHWRQAGVEGVNTLHFLVGALLGEKGGTKEFTVLIDELPSSLQPELKKRTLEVFNDFQTLGFAPEHLVENFSRPENIQTLTKKFTIVIDDLLKYGEG